MWKGIFNILKRNKFCGLSRSMCSQSVTC